jgi:HEPN domain-containing protein
MYSLKQILIRQIEHASAALVEGNTRKVPEVAVHAKAALDLSLAASLIAKSIPKNHINSRSKALHDFEASLTTQGLRNQIP